MHNLKDSQKFILIAVLMVTAAIVQGQVVGLINVPFIGLMYPVTIYVAWKFGFRKSVFAIAVAFFAILFFMIEPRMTFKVADFRTMVPTFVYAMTSLICSWVVARGHSWERRGTETLDQLERFRRSVHATNLGIWYCDLPFDVLTWDRTTKEHFWLPEDAIVTIDLFYERIHPEDREFTRAAIAKSIAERGPYDIIYRTTHPDDIRKVKHIRAIGWTDYDAAGNPIRFDGVTVDSTHLHRVSADLAESLEVVETINRVGQSLSGELDQKKLVQQVTDAATQLSRAEFGAFFYNLINEKGESYTLYTVSGVSIDNFNKFPMPRNTEVFAPTFNGDGIIRSDDIKKDPRYGHNDPYHGMPEGHLPVTSYLAVPVKSRTGEVIGGLFLGHKDFGVFSERDEKIVAGLASQIAIAMDNARLFQKVNESVRLRDEFLSISSHELKTPLTSLKMQLQLFGHILKMDQGPVPEERVKKIVEVSERQVNRLNSLVEDLLDVSRIASGKLSLTFEPVDLAALIHEVVDRYLPLIRQTRCMIDVHAPPTLMLVIDRIRIEQVLINLISNAMKYAPESEITIRLEEVAGMVELSVKDNGPGIPKQHQERIFSRFERVSAREGKGLGLGLYIVHQIVEAHDGTITLNSDVGKGAEFLIRIPGH